MSDASPTYVSKLKTALVQEWRGLHQKFKEVEDLRYFEDRIGLRAEERTSGIEVHMGLVAELIENVKSALTSNQSTPQVTPGIKTPKGKSNSSRRELFWGAWLKSINQPTGVLTRLVDAQAMGLGILKGSYTPWPAKERERRTGEARDDYLERQEGLKRIWGPPLSVIDIHPLTFYPAMGMRDMPEEILEISWKPRRQVYRALGLEDSTSVSTITKIEPGLVSATGGFPSSDVRSLPAGMDSSMMLEVTEYWREDCYQIYLGPIGSNGPVYETDAPPVEYFMALGRTTSSRDPDKMSLSVAEFLRNNEPILNRAVTRMFEAADLLVQKRLVAELPEGSLDEFEHTTEGDNQPERTTITLEPGKIKALPPQAKVQDPFTGAEHVYESMGVIQLMMDLAGRHGVAPIFKGITSGAGASGYKDNSLYLMAMSQFFYIRDAYQDCLTNLVRWAERQIVDVIQQKVYMDDFELTAADIADYPASVKVNLEPYLPQSFAMEAQLYDQMHARGHITRRMVVEKGLKEGQPDEIEDERMKEDLKDMLRPILYRDVMTEVGLALPEQTSQEVPPSSGLLGPDGEPISSNGGSPQGQRFAGAATGGQPRQPAKEPGTV